ncbi:phospholipase D-like domain-containing protein [Ornithobacterium rhinotracheale]|uniref:phospholipase D-like domain-containing protein n=1 Tax=Ornithobacterium rhinotracheale TaxID=28251 RepID=UPI001FF6F4F2|nr:phospholipase D-like domain-containing protein [Ornithobacterium rhinotracheale]MCK0206297.1 phospholipase D-like domain-containing protein [Ornithobacterium rhinotracheale]
MSVKLISDTAHYTEVILRASKVRRSLWIGTADIKDLYTDFAGQKVPFLAVLANLVRKGVDVRLIHAKEPGPMFREDFERYPILWERLERVLCPRVHFKMMIFDYSVAYIGSANLTGAGLGAKNENKRNFETGILTDNPKLVDAAADQFDRVWMGLHCKKCARKQFCKDPIG